MKDFDADRRAGIKPASERTFQLGGEVFVLKATAHPSVMARFDQVDTDKPGETINLIDETIEDLLVAPGPELWRKVRAVKADPGEVSDGRFTITLEDMNGLVEWMLEVLSDRPTERPAPSSDGPPTPGTFSTVTSDSEVSTPPSLISVGS